MSKKLLTKWLPKPEYFYQQKSLAWLRTHLENPSVWHLNRRSVSAAVAIGLFTCFLPIPMQMLVSGLIAIFLGANLAVSVVMVWVSNPVTMPVLFYGAYLIGAAILNSQALPLPDTLSLEWLQSELVGIWKPFILGCLICGVTSAIIGFFSVRWLWRLNVVKKWKLRQKKRQQPY